MHMRGFVNRNLSANSICNRDNTLSANLCPLPAGKGDYHVVYLELVCHCSGVCERGEVAYGFPNLRYNRNCRRSAKWRARVSVGGILVGTHMLHDTGNPSNPNNPQQPQFPHDGQSETARQPATSVQPEITPRAIDITSPEHKANPHRLYARLRAETPVCPVLMPDKQTAWLVTRYDDVVAVLKDERFVKDRFRSLAPQFSQKQPWMPAVFKPLMQNMLDSDAPNHTRLRSLVQLAFTPRRVNAMAGRIQELSNQLLDDFILRGQTDLIRDYALPLPTTVIAEFLGVPVADRHKFHRWSARIVSLNWSKWDMVKGIPAVWSFLRYIRKLVKTKRTNPQDDMITALVQAEEAGDRLSEDELVAMIFLLLVAGHETTVNLIANGTVALLQYPDQLERLIAEPELIKPAVEELLRFAPPLDTATERFAREDISVAGTTIPAGSLVFAVLNSANRDEQQFPEADQLNIARDPNRHLSFGLGVHFCLGSSLARLEAQTAINSLLQRTKDLRLAVPAEELKWRRGPILRGMQALPLLFANR